MSERRRGNNGHAKMNGHFKSTGHLKRDDGAQPLENESILTMEGPASVASATDATGLMAALPNNQAEAAALNELIHTNTIISPPVGGAPGGEAQKNGKRRGE